MNASGINDSGINESSASADGRLFARLTARARLWATTPVESRLTGTWTAPLSVRLSGTARDAVSVAARLTGMAGTAPMLEMRLSAPAGAAPALHARLSAPTGAAPALHARLSAPTGAASALHARLSAPTGAAPALHARLSAPTGAAPALHARLSGTARLSASRFVRLAMRAALVGADPVVARLTMRAALLTDAVQMIAAPNHLVHQGRICPLLNAGLSADSGSPVWLADLALADSEDYRRVRIGDTLTLMFWGQPISLVCDSRQRGRAHDGDSYRLSAISPVARRGAPWHGELTSGAVGLARAAVETLLGAAVEWRLPDWPLPAAAAHLTGTPLAIAQQIAAAAGGLVSSNLDGTVRVQPRDPAGVPGRAAATAVALGAGDLLGQSDRLGSAAIVNRLVIGSGSVAAGGARLQLESEADPDDGHAYTVRAYPYPWRPVDLVHTGDAATEIGGRAEVTPEHEEQVEIQAGQGSVRYPVAALLDTSYRHVALGAVTADGTDLTTADPQYSLLDVRYRTRCWQWRVTNARDETIQFLAVE